MRPTTTYPDTLHFLPEAAGTDAGRGAALRAGIRTVLGAFRDGLSAAHDYKRLTARGVAPDAAASRVFAAHFEAR
ncbi:MAG TPA: hypothetical protein VJ233_00340 [Hyphomicrobiaceae bacterium]|nr:hypothetical protein [Hyphomicrobiaceae bacterium]